MGDRASMPGCWCVLGSAPVLGLTRDRGGGAFYNGVVSTIELPDDVAAALAAAAAQRGMTEAELIAELVPGRPEPAGLDGFLGCMDSGDPEWAGTDTAVLRKQVDARHSA